MNHARGLVLRCHEQPSKKNNCFVSMPYIAIAPLSKALAGAYHPDESAHNARRNIFHAF
ncbi:hypothetical protein [Bradyrhizobium japonicum]|uniref:hypothetical protein n=1 Tax=Bradyrhizobium japonicum TaxID=375 RepID=UPI001BA6821D|nr:hypothetical protein [Bradyrhizobium japonicum]MBR0914200.1 hypothetical protein [Bradyrhizobium japonicum]